MFAPLNVFEKEKIVPLSSRRDTMDSRNSSRLSTPQTREKKEIARHEVRSPINMQHCAWLVC